jgi:hypothetical protein
MRYRLLVAAAMTAGACIASAPQASASSHREAPFVTKNPKVDSTDVYAFKSYEAGRAGYVTLIANYQPFQDSYGGPNYFALDPEALYEIHVDQDGDGVEDVTFQFQFQNALNAGGGAGQCALCNLPVTLDGVTKTNSVSLMNVGGVGPAVTDTGALHVVETYSLKMVTGDRRTGTVTPLGGTFHKPADNIGTTSIPDYTAYANNHITEFDIPPAAIAGCVAPAGTKPRVFVGQRAESFAANIGVIFDLLQTPSQGFFNAITQSLGPDSAAGRGRNAARPADIGLLSGKNITTLAIEIPEKCLVKGTQPVIGVWTTASVRQARVINPAPTYGLPAKEGGAWTQVSRLGMPLVNEVVIGLKDKDTFGGAAPKGDAALADYVTHPTLPKLIEVLHGARGAMAPKKTRADLVAAFGTGLSVTLVDGTKVDFTKNTMGVHEYIRLNTAALLGPATSKADQITKANGLGALGCFTADRHVDTAAAACDLQGFPNGRRPGDDALDITLRVAMGALFDNDADAPNRNVNFTDGNFNGPEQFGDKFPYLNDPNAGNMDLPASRKN